MEILWAALGGFCLDLLLGDPAWMPHPVVYMGKAISALEGRLRSRLPKTPRGELWGGAALAAALPIGTLLLCGGACLLAERLHPADEKRILRALEVYRETGKTITAHNEETKALPPRYDAVWIGLQFADRADMKALIDKRVDRMAEAGLLEEVRALLSLGLPRNATALQAIGYKEFLGVLEGTATEAEALAEVKLRSRQYAKRQLTWLRRNPAIHWVFWEKDRNFARALQISTEILSAAGVS